METLEALGKRIGTTQDLQAIVRTMKSLSTVSIRQYEHAVVALRVYSRTIELGLQIILREAPWLHVEPKPPDGPIAAIVFGSDHGLCGRFNAQISHFAAAEMANLSKSTENRRYLVVGAQAASRLEVMGQRVDAFFNLPSSVTGLTATAHGVLHKIDEWQTDSGITRVSLFHNARSVEAMASPVARQLLPLDYGWLERLAKQKWPSHAIPTHTMDSHDLFSSLIREHLFVTIFRAGAESMASEHATRLASMQAADRSIQEHLEEMNGAFRRRRQQAITEELLDVVSGFEALRIAEASGTDELRFEGYDGGID